MTRSGTGQPDTFMATPPEVFAELIIFSVDAYFYEQFQIYFLPRAYKLWYSSDNPTNPFDMMNEAIRKTGFFTGKQMNDYTLDVLIIFTDDNLPIEIYGCSNRSLGAVLVRHTYRDGVGQATDNVLQHELSHLYYAEHNYEAGLDCVMNRFPYWIDFPFYYEVPTTLVTTAWCPDCTQTINANRNIWGETTLDGGGGGSWGIWKCMW